MRLRRLAALVAAVPLTLTALAGPAVSAPSPAASAAASPAASGAATPAATHFRPGAPGGGDPYFPLQGNGGYDVEHYDLTVRYHPQTRDMYVTERVTARATTNLSRFNLDLRRFLHVTHVVVGAGAARFRQARTHELVITPRTPLPKGHQFDVKLSYHGKPHAVHDPDGSLDGFIRTGDGAFVASEPQGAPTWMAVNDAPSDKATYTLALIVRRGYTAVSNGKLVAHHGLPGGRALWLWRIRKPISSYLVTATIGRFETRRGRTPGGVGYFEAVDPREAKAWRVLRKLPAIVDFYSRTYGAYPFGSVGAIVDHAQRVGYALETATRPLFDRAPSQYTLAHELAHQWYGDTVTLRHWRDIWLNEGFAEFSSWLWGEHIGGLTTAQHLRALMRKPASSGIWSPPPGNPGDAEHIFSGSVYERGAATLARLREVVGDATFFRIMRGWLTAHRYGNARVGQFTAYAAKVADRNLGPLFHRWLYHHGKPGT